MTTSNPPTAVEALALSNAQIEWAKRLREKADSLEASANDLDGWSAILTADERLAMHSEVTSLRAGADALQALQLHGGGESRSDFASGSGDMPAGERDYTAQSLADLRTAIERSITLSSPDFPNYADWPIALPAGHWRAILALLNPTSPWRPKNGELGIIKRKEGKRPFVAEWNESDRGLARGWWDGMWRTDETEVEWMMPLPALPGGAG